LPHFTPLGSSVFAFCLRRALHRNGKAKLSFWAVTEWGSLNAKWEVNDDL
jgi:hypothetical protein